MSNCMSRKLPLIHFESFKLFLFIIKLFQAKQLHFWHWSLFCILKISCLFLTSENKNSRVYSNWDYNIHQFYLRQELSISFYREGLCCQEQYLSAGSARFITCCYALSASCPPLVWFICLRENEERPIKTLLKLDRTSIVKLHGHSILFK